MFIPNLVNHQSVFWSFAFIIVQPIFFFMTSSLYKLNYSEGLLEWLGFFVEYISLKLFTFFISISLMLQICLFFGFCFPSRVQTSLPPTLPRSTSDYHCQDRNFSKHFLKVVSFILQTLQLSFRHHIRYSLLNWIAYFEMLIGSERSKICKWEKLMSFFCGVLPSAGSSI